MQAAEAFDAACGAFGNVKELDTCGYDDEAWPVAHAGSVRNVLYLSTDFGVFVHIHSPVMR